MNETQVGLSSRWCQLLIPPSAMNALCYDLRIWVRIYAGISLMLVFCVFSSQSVQR